MLLIMRHMMTGHPYQGDAFHQQLASASSFPHCPCSFVEDLQAVQCPPIIIMHQTLAVGIVMTQSLAKQFAYRKGL